jgi:Na+/H+ antiporter NhaA
MVLNNRTYDLLKWIALVFLPAFITFVGVVLNCFDVPYTDIVLTISVAFNTFLGSILGISNINYNKMSALREETSDGRGDDEDEE